MGINIGDNLNYQGSKFNVERDSFQTKALMKAYPETSLPPKGFRAYCAEDDEYYEFNATNEVDPDTGKWRLVDDPAAKQTVKDAEQQAEYARQQGDAAKEAARAVTNDVLFKVFQSLTEEEQAQVKQNIGIDVDSKFRGQKEQESDLTQDILDPQVGDYAYVGNPRHLYVYKSTGWKDLGEFNYNTDQEFDPESTRAIANKKVTAKLSELEGLRVFGETVGYSYADDGLIPKIDMTKDFPYKGVRFVAITNSFSGKISLAVYHPEESTERSIPQWEIKGKTSILDMQFNSPITRIAANIYSENITQQGELTLIVINSDIPQKIYTLKNNSLRDNIILNKIENTDNIGVFGDSLVAGDVGGTVTKNTWIKRLSELCGCAIVNHGVRGSGFAITDTDLNIVDKIKSTDLSVYTKIIIAGGTNDHNQGYSIEEIQSKLDELFLYLQDNYEGDVFIITPINKVLFKDTSFFIDIDDVRKCIYNKAVEYGYNVIDGRNFPFYTDSDELYAEDGIHLTELGYRVYADYIYSLLGKEEKENDLYSDYNIEYEQGVYYNITEGIVNKKQDSSGRFSSVRVKVNSKDSVYLKFCSYRHEPENAPCFFADKDDAPIEYIVNSDYTQIDKTFAVPINAAYLYVTNYNTSQPTPLCILSKNELAHAIEGLEDLEKLQNDFKTLEQTVANNSSEINNLKNNNYSSHTDYLKTLTECNFAGKIIHFSVDDTCQCLQDLINNESVYSSIFENSFLADLKYFFETYGAKFTLNCFVNTVENEINPNPTSPTLFNIDNVPSKFQSEFQEHKKWLKFSYHAVDNTATWNHGETEVEYYKRFVNAIHKMTGDYEFIDRQARAGFFGANKETVLVLKNTDYGITILSYCEGDARVGYYLDAAITKQIAKRGKYIDIDNELLFVRSQTRIESRSSENTIFADLEDVRKQKIVECFFHEQNYNKTYLENVIERAKQEGYVFEFISSIFDL